MTIQGGANNTAVTTQSIANPLSAGLNGSLTAQFGKNNLATVNQADGGQTGLQPIKRADSLSMTLAGFMRKTSMVPVISDFLFDNPGDVLKELAHLNSNHDVFVVLIDSAFAFELPPISAGWIEAFDVETGKARVMSRGAANRRGIADRGLQ